MDARGSGPVSWTWLSVAERCGGDEPGDPGWIHGATFWRIFVAGASEKFAAFGTNVCYKRCPVGA